MTALQKQSHVLIPTISGGHVNGIRRGSWVVHMGRIGILHEIHNDHAVIHLTDQDGATTEHINVGHNEFRIAKISEIPEKRFFPGLPTGAALIHAENLGYLE